MIERYTRAEMGAVFAPEARFQFMLEVEIAVARVQARLGLIPPAAAEAIAQKGRFSLARILEIEKTTKHDVIAFVSNVAENVGEMGRFVHYGLTSSDVLDTALSLQTKKAYQVLTGSLEKLLAALQVQIEHHKSTWMSGRTHGMHAEPTTFGLKLAGHYAEFVRARQRLALAAEEMAVGKLSGAVGTFSLLPAEVEAQVCEELGLTPEPVATQVIPRDRHANLMTQLAILGGAFERLGVELRHLQRTEVSEVIEGFEPGQKGSSAMPHKKNPISSENVTGLARLLRGYAMAAMEDIALWHERDISHSAVERVIVPDGFILADFACDRMAHVLARLFVDSSRMRANMELSQGQLFSSRVLLALVDQGLSREEAYKLVQALSHGLKPGEQMQTKLTENADVARLLKPAQINDIFSGARYQQAVDQLIARALETGATR